MPARSHNAMRGGRGPWLIVAALLAALVATCSHPNQAPLTPETNTNSVAAIFAPAPAFAQTKQTGDVTIADIAERAVPSVVNISAEKVRKQQAMRSPFYNDPFFRDFFGTPRQGVPKERREQSLGSGVIVDASGIVITNNHVVEHAENIRVSLADGRELDAKVAGTDPKSDLAILELEGDVKNLTPLPFGDSSALRLGDVVIAIGNPFGVGQTVTMGIVSAKGRGNVGIVDYEDFIQTDAAINPGNSGGALVNMRGELVGVNTAILSRSGGYQGIGFAIPTALAKPILNSLRQHGKVVRGWLGVGIQPLTDELAESLGVDVKRGVLISDVTSDGPADKAGFKRGDVVVKMNGIDMTSTSKLRNQIAIAGPGASASFEVVRGEKRVELEATLKELPTELAGNTVEPKGGILEGATLGVLDNQTRRKFDISNRVKSGVVILEVERASRAARLGLRAGDVILEVNRKPVKTPAALEAVVNSAKGNLLVLIGRGNSTVFLTLRR